MPEHKGINRREFLKKAGQMGISIPAAEFLWSKNRTYLPTSAKNYGDSSPLYESLKNPPYDVDSSRYERFKEKNQMFSRAVWDKEAIEMRRRYRSVSFSRMENKEPGYTRLDYAFYTAAWTAHSTQRFYRWEPMGGFPAGEGLLNMPRWSHEDLSPRQLTDVVKKAALFYGASLVGITEIDERWVYSHAYVRGRRRETAENTGPSTREPEIVFKDVDKPVKFSEDNTVIIPKAMKYVIALAIEMDLDCTEAGPTCIAAAATGNGYSRMAFTAGTLAEFIRALGYNAAPMWNDTALSIPIAVDAGLGELGKLGLLITPKYGPRVRLCKVFTDLPLLKDHPIRFGATEFCEICGKCAEDCPSEAITIGPRTYEPINFSNNPGVLKWPVDGFKCHTFWSENGVDCNNCIRVCPFNKYDTWVHEAARLLIEGKSELINKTILTLDNATRYGVQSDPRGYWKKNNFIHIKS